MHQPLFHSQTWYWPISKTSARSRGHAITAASRSAGREVQRLHLDDCLFAQHARQRSRLHVLGKGRRQRMVYVATDAEAALFDWLALRRLRASPCVFTNRWGRPSPSRASG